MPRQPHNPRPARPAQSRRSFLVATGRILGGALLLPALRPGDLLARALPGPTGAAAASGALPPARAALADLLQSAVADLEKRFAGAFALYTRHEALTVDADRRGLRITESGPREGVVLVAFDNGSFREEATSDVSAAGVEKAKAALLVDPPLVKSADSPDPGPRLQASRVERGVENAAALEIRGLVDRVREMQARLLAMNPRLAEASLQASTGVTERLFVNRTRRLHQELGRGGIRATVTCGADKGAPGVISMERRGVGGLEWTRIEEAELARLVERAARLAGASSADPGVRVVVLEPDVTGVLAHALFGHGMEIDPFNAGRVRAAGGFAVGQPAGSKLVRILDDPTRAGGNGFHHFDDEGLAGTPTTIVEDGIFRAGLADLAAALRLKLPRTASGHRAGFDSRTYARASNIFFAPGATSPGELVRGVTDGLLVGNVLAESADSTDGELRLVARYGEEIRNGRLTGRVFSPVVLGGAPADVLGSIDGVGSDFALAAGACARGCGEPLPVGIGGPHLRLKARVS